MPRVNDMDPYEKFIDADRNRVAWVALFKRAEEALHDLDQYAPKIAKRLRARFYDDAAQPLLSARAGLDVVEYLEACRDEMSPLSWDDAVRCAEEVGRSPYAIADEHRRWALDQE